MSVVGAYAVCHPPIILPEVGEDVSTVLAKTIASYRQVARAIVDDRPETVVIISPHATFHPDHLHISTGGEAHGNLWGFGAPQCRMTVAYDEAFVSELCDRAGDAGISSSTHDERVPELDHATMIPLLFVAREMGVDPQTLPDHLQVVRVGDSGLDGAAHYLFGRCIAETAAKLGRRTVVIASGDLSHALSPDAPAGFSEEGAPFDEAVCTALESADLGALLLLDPLRVRAARQCGLDPFLVMAGSLDGQAVRGGLLSYEHPFGVGYAMAAFHPVGADAGRRFLDAYEEGQRATTAVRRHDEDLFVRTARASMTAYLQDERILTLGQAQAVVGPMPAALVEMTAGVFVSIYRHGRLRGCMGSIEPITPCVAEEIIHNALLACTDDPRFSPVREEEMDLLTIHVDVLGPLEDVDGQDGLDPSRYGVVVSDQTRRGVLLPGIAGIETVEEQVGVARRKGGFLPDEPVRMQRFEVVRHT